MTTLQDAKFVNIDDFHISTDLSTSVIFVFKFGCDIMKLKRMKRESRNYNFQIPIQVIHFAVIQAVL